MTNEPKKTSAAFTRPDSVAIPTITRNFSFNPIIDSEANKLQNQYKKTAEELERINEALKRVESINPIISDLHVAMTALAQHFDIHTRGRKETAALFRRLVRASMETVNNEHFGANPNA